jgi:SAM-dependent methyltransferase
MALLRCPVTGEELVQDGSTLRTASGRSYAVVDGVPVLVDAHRGLLDPQRCAQAPGPPRRRRLIRPWDWITRNVASAENYRALGEMLPAGARVLVVGGGTEGRGLRELLDRPGIDVLETDVFRGPRTQLVCDGHDLPLAGGSVDAVVCQGVLAFLVDPQRVVAEIHRVLRADGLLYSEVPFIQQVCNGPYDFTRWTALGHRRLLRDFDVVRSGATGGPGMALAWSVAFFARALGGRSLWVAGALLAAPLKWLDGMLAARSGALDAASGTFILGRRRETPVSDAEIVAAYRA